MAGSMMNKLGHILPVNRTLLICAAMSGGLLVAAFLFEYVGGLAPCKMCIWQRWAHVALILTALSGLLIPTQIRAKPALMCVVVAAMISAAIAGFHAGVEWQLWDGATEPCQLVKTYQAVCERLYGRHADHLLARHPHDGANPRRAEAVHGELARAV